MTEVERAVAEGWRFLALKPSEVYSLTPRELVILMKAQQERQYDEYERMSTGAMMTRQAYHAKKLKTSELFARPKDNAKQKGRKTTEELRKYTEQQQALLSQFSFERKA